MTNASETKHVQQREKKPTILADALRTQGKETTKCMFFTLFGGLLPVYGGYILLKLFHKDMSMSDFTNNGEFAIYSAALLGPALYLIFKEYPKARMPLQTTLGGFCIVSLLLSSMIFAGVTSVNTGKLPIEIDKDFLRISTIVLFAVTAILSFLVTALDGYRVMPGDINNIHNESLEQLEKEFDPSDVDEAKNGK